MRPIIRRGLPLLLALELAACPGGDPSPDTGPADGGGDATGALDGGADAPPPVTLTPCPTGWTERWDDGDTLTWCDPWPDGAQRVCGPDEAHFTGEPGCTTVGPACPTGLFASDLPADATVIYAEAGALAGDGTEISPFGSVAEAAGAAVPGTVIALARGLFDEEISVPAGVTLQGACAGGTRLTATSMTARAVVLAAAPDAVVRDLRVVGVDTQTGVRVVPPGSVSVEGVIIEGVDAAFVAVDTTLRARGVATIDASSSLVTVDAADVEISRISVEPDDTSAGMLLTFGAASVRVTQAAIAGHDWGVVSLDQAALEMRDSVLGSLQPGGIFMVGAGSVDLDRVLIEDTTSSGAAGRDGNALALQGGASARVGRSVFQRNRDAAVLAIGAGTRVEMMDVALRDCAPELCEETTCPGEGGGSGLVVADAASASASRFLITRASVCGVQVAAGASLDLQVGVVAESSIGACVQVDDFDVARLSDRVAYRDNGTNLDSVDLPVPSIDSSTPIP